MVFPLGANGCIAAEQFKKVPPSEKHATSIQYSPTGKDHQALADLIEYASAFASEPDEFTAQDIAAASGLDLDKLPDPKFMEALWDLDGNGHVDTSEVVAGLAHLDWLDGQLDGKITQQGCENAEGFFGRAALEKFKHLEATELANLLQVVTDEVAETEAQVGHLDNSIPVPPTVKLTETLLRISEPARAMLADLHREYQQQVKDTYEAASLKLLSVKYREEHPLDMLA